MYPEGDDPSSPPQKEKDDQDEKDDGHTELVSKKLLDVDEDTEVKPGDEFVLQVVKDYGSEVELKYAPKKEKETPKEEMSSDEELDSLDSMKGKEY